MGHLMVVSTYLSLVVVVTAAAWSVVRISSLGRWY
jgi:hypothetical protein